MVEESVQSVPDTAVELFAQSEDDTPKVAVESPATDQHSDQEANRNEAAEIDPATVETLAVKAELQPAESDNQQPAAAEEKAEAEAATEANETKAEADDTASTKPASRRRARRAPNDPREVRRRQQADNKDSDL
jgi:ribonuclease E